jgi:biopolymer transport protein ExbB
MEFLIIVLAEGQLGLLTYPLFFSLLVSLIIMIERFGVLSYHSLSNTLIHNSTHLVNHHHSARKDLREEVASIWLQAQHVKLSNGIRLLNIISLLAPLLGLLGTVIGLIKIFDNLGMHHGPIEPSMLAEGLGIAMKTTAAGLCIAIPSLLCAHGFQIWGDKLIKTTEKNMNIQNLQLDGICTEALA